MGIETSARLSNTLSNSESDITKWVPLSLTLVEYPKGEQLN